MSNLLVCKPEASGVQKKQDSVEVTSKGKGWAQHPQRDEGDLEMRDAELRLGRTVTSEQNGENRRNRVGVLRDEHAGGPGSSFQAYRAQFETILAPRAVWISPGRSQKHAKASPGTEGPAASREDNGTLKGSGLGIA